MSADFADETWRYILLPVFIAAYPYQDKSYQVLVNGQTGKLVGQKPVSWFRVSVAMGASFLPALIAAIVALVLASNGEAPGVLLLVAAALFIVGAIIAATLAASAQKAVQG